MRDEQFPSDLPLEFQCGAAAAGVAENRLRAKAAQPPAKEGTPGRLPVPASPGLHPACQNIPFPLLIIVFTNAQSATPVVSEGLKIKGLKVNRRKKDEKVH